MIRIQPHILGVISLAMLSSLSACQPSPTLNSGSTPFLSQPVISKLTKADIEKEKAALDGKIARFLEDPSAEELNFGASNAALDQYTVQQVNELRKKAQRVNLSGVLELPPENNVSGISLTAYAPDGSTLGLKQ